MDSVKHEEVTIIDKDDTSNTVCHVVDGFLLEESNEPFPNSRPSFVPEEYGRSAKPGRGRPPKKTVTVEGAMEQPPIPQDGMEQPPIPNGMARCEKCGILGDINSFMKPSKRFCSTTCCKSYSAEKRYYPYGKDAKGVARSIQEGLLSTSRAALLAKRQRIRQRCRRQLGYDVELPPLPPEATEDGPKKRGRKKKVIPPPINEPSSNIPLGEPPTLPPVAMPTYTHPRGLSIYSWSLDDVSMFLKEVGCEAYVDLFVYHEIDGKALTLLKDYHLLNRLDMKVGPALRIISHIDSIKTYEIG